MGDNQETEVSVQEVVREYMTRARKAQRIAETYSQ